MGLSTRRSIALAAEVLGSSGVDTAGVFVRKAPWTSRGEERAFAKYSTTTSRKPRYDTFKSAVRQKPLQLLLLLILVQRPAFLLAQPSAHDRAFAEASAGVALSRQERYPEAIRAYKRAITLDPQLRDIYLNLGLAYFKSGDFRGAAESFTKQDNLAPSTRVKTLLAMSRFGLAQYREAANLLEPLASAEPGNTELSYLLAKCYLWSKQTDRAMRLFQMLLSQNPNSAAVHLLMGEALDADRRTADAIVEFQAAVKANPSQPDVHFGLGYLYWELRDYQNAEREFRQELERNPSDPQALTYLGDVQLKTGREAEAFASLTKAIALDKNLRTAHVDLAAIYEKQKNYSKAVAHLKQAIQLDSEAFDAHYRLARIYKLLNQPANAEKELAIVKRLHEEKTAKPLMEVSGPR
jgi:tetratricopeptide (TPR) repeat protein